MESSQLFTWKSLTTIGSASLLCFLIVSYTKRLVSKFFKWVPTDVYALVVSFVILVISQLATTPNVMYDWRIYVLAFFNSFIVAASSAHIHNKALHPPDLKSNVKTESQESGLEITFSNTNYNGEDLKK